MRVHISYIKRLLIFSVVLSFTCCNLMAAPNKVQDFASLFSATEIESLEPIIEDIYATWNFDIAIVTTEDTKGYTPTAYADNFFQEEGYGYGSNLDGMILLIDMNERELVIRTFGTGINIFDDARIDSLLDDLYGYAVANDFYVGVQNFLDNAEHLLEVGPKSDQYTEYVNIKHEPFKNQYGEPLTPKSTLFSILIAIVGAGIITLTIRGIISFRYHHPRYSAPATLPEQHSVSFTEREDNFVTSHTSKVRIQSNNDSSLGGGSRSSVHRTSSGRSSGGGSRKF